MIRIAIDCKNIAVHSGGIAVFLQLLADAWLRHRPDVQFLLIGPDFDEAFLPKSGNWKRVKVGWPNYLPRPIRHPFYDNFLFPMALKKIDFDLLFTPYHDVRLPGNRRSVMMIHDTCLLEMVGVYPWRIRAYYDFMLRHNLPIASKVLTVSETSRQKISTHYGCGDGKVEVIYNSLDADFYQPAKADEIQAIRAKHPGSPLVFYPGGAEYRKNVQRLMEAIGRIQGAHLMVTGTSKEKWAALGDRVTVVGRLNIHELKNHYAAADVVVYPSLCEGFGRVIVEAMVLGTPMAISDIPVSHEVGGDYPVFFDPYDIDAIATGIVTAARQGRRPPRIDQRFSHDAVVGKFLTIMDREIDNISSSIAETPPS